MRDGSTFKFDLVRKGAFTLQAALREAKSYIQATDLCSPGSQSDSKKSDKQKDNRPAQPAKKKEESKKRKEVWAVSDSEQPSQKKKKEFKPYVPRYEFNKDCNSILMEVKDRLSIEKPNPMKSSVQSRNKNKYCQFHEEVGHDTNDCFSLQRTLDRLADKGLLKSSFLSPQLGQRRGTRVSTPRLPPSLLVARILTRSRSTQ